MRLSLWILKNWMHEYKPELRAIHHEDDPQHINAIRIEKVRLYDGMGSFEESTLYVGDSQLFFPNLYHHVVCRFHDDCLIFPTENVTLIFNQILNAFFYYESWEKRMDQLMARQCSLTELLDASHEILKNPLLIHDSSDAIIAVSTSYLNVEVDEHWYQLLAFGATDPDKSVEFHKHGSPLFDHGNHMPYYIPAGFFPRSTWSQNIFRQNEWCGICVIIEYRQPLNTGMLHLFYLFSQMIQEYSNTQSEHNAFKLQSSFLLEAMDGNEKDLQNLRRKLTTGRWELQDQMIIIKAVPLSSEYHAHTYLCRIFAKYSPYIFPAAQNNDILLLCNISRLSKRELFYFLQPWLKNSFYRCGASQPFSDLRMLPAACRQTDIALQYGDMAAGSIHQIHDYMVHWLINILKSHTDTSVLHPAILKMAEYDKNHHTDYSRTLFRYLENGLNSILTAKALNIHRNTLFHRLERIKELFPLDLSDPRERFYLMLCFYYTEPEGKESALPGNSFAAGQNRS